MSAGSVDIPVKIIEGNDTLVMLARIVNALEGTGRAADTAAPKARSLGASLSGVGEAARHVNEIREAVVSFGEGLVAAAERVAALTAEQQRLTANSTRLGLDFQRAADGAGGFVSEMQTMQLATSLANRNIRVTQSELDALARVGMARAVDAGKNVEEVFDSIADSVVEGGEELEKFGSSLHGVADDSHTASDRLSALVARGREVTPAIRTAADEVARFRNELQRAQRTISEGFTSEFARLSQLGRPIREAADDAEEFNRELQAAGATAALIVHQVGNGFGAVIGTLATGITAAIGGVASLAAAVSALARGESPTAAASSAFEGFMGAGSTGEQLMRWTNARINAVNAGADSQDSRRLAAPETASTSRPGDMIITAEEIGIDPRTGRPLRRGAGAGGGGARQRPPTMEELMQRAISGSRPEARLSPIAPTREELAALERSQDRAREAAQRQQENDAEIRERAFARSDEGIRAQAQKDRATRREERDLNHRYEQNRGFTERMEELSHRRIYAAQEEADAINGAFGAMGRAFSDHLTAVVEGREELGVALQGMLSDTLSAIAKESSIKAGLNLAEGFAALATYRYDAAAEHFAAAGIYTGVAVAAGLAGAALAPSTPDKGAGGGAAAREPASPQGAPGGPARGETVINVAFNGPQFGTGGVVQAARELVGVLNAGAVQGGVQINRLAVGGIR